MLRANQPLDDVQGRFTEGDQCAWTYNVGQQDCDVAAGLQQLCDLDRGGQVSSSTVSIGTGVFDSVRLSLPSVRSASRRRPCGKEQHC